MTVSTPADNERYASLAERLAPLGAVAVAVLSQVLMRDRIVLGPLLLAPIIEVGLGALLVLGEGVLRAHRHRMEYVRYVLALVLACSATASSTLLIDDVVHAESVSVQQLLSEGVQILVVLAVGFALLFWQLDRGGPNGRVQPVVERMSFWFTQDAIREYSDQFDTWQPRFLDYLYVAITNLFAFLTHRHDAAYPDREDADGLGVGRLVLHPGRRPGPSGQHPQVTAPRTHGRGRRGVKRTRQHRGPVRSPNQAYDAARRSLTRYAMTSAAGKKTRLNRKYTPAL